MNIREVLADIRSDRVKKVIFDTDAYNEMDDQYAFTYALASEKIDVIGINAVLFNNPRCNGFKDGMEKSYDEILHVLDLLGLKDKVPVYLGCEAPMTDEPVIASVASPASENIIKCANESDELIYVLATGAATNVSTALLHDPSIKDKICVVWLGGHCINAVDECGEFNMGQDLVAAQYLLNCGVNLVQLPAVGPKPYGTQMLLGHRDTLDMIVGDSAAARYLRDELPAACDPDFLVNPEWWHIFWDVAAPALLDDPDSLEVEIIMAERIRGDGVYAFDPDRHDIIYMHKLDPERMLKRTFEAINTII